MFRVRVFTPSVVNEEGLPHAGAELVLGPERLRFLVDLRHWSIADYERQWRQGVARMLHGATSTALMIAYRGPGEATHLMWALWRDQGHVYVQQHPVISAELVAHRRMAHRHRAPFRLRPGHPLALLSRLTPALPAAQDTRVGEV
jgi:hypothetical protein